MSCWGLMFTDLPWWGMKCYWVGQASDCNKKVSRTQGRMCRHDECSREPMGTLPPSLGAGGIRKEEKILMPSLFVFLLLLLLFFSCLSGEGTTAVFEGVTQCSMLTKQKATKTAWGRGIVLWGGRALLTSSVRPSARRAGNQIARGGAVGGDTVCRRARRHEGCFGGRPKVYSRCEAKSIGSSSMVVL